MQSHSNYSCLALCLPRRRRPAAPPPPPPPATPLLLLAGLSLPMRSPLAKLSASGHAREEPGAGAAALTGHSRPLDSGAGAGPAESPLSALAALRQHAVAAALASGMPTPGALAAKPPAVQNKGVQ